MKNKLLAKILCNVFAVLFGIISAGASIAFENSTAINSYLGVTTQKIVKTGESTPCPAASNNVCVSPVH